MKKIIVLTLISISLLGTAVVFADSPAEIFASIKGVSTEEAYTQRGNGKTFGRLASEEGFLDQFKKKVYDAKKEVIEQRVKDGKLTQEKAQEFLDAYESRMESCTGTPARLGKGLGMGFGNGNGGGKGMGFGQGFGR